MNFEFPDSWHDALADLGAVLDAEIFRVGTTSFTWGLLLKVLFLVIALFWIGGALRKLLSSKILSRSSMDAASRQMISTLFYYAFLVIGLMVIIQAAGIPLTTLNVLAGALGIGVGLGLQEVFKNFVSGLVILFERPIKIGDRVLVGEVDGSIVEIRARSTTVLTNDNVAIIIPNSSFITDNVINWTYNDPRIRFRIPVGVAYGSDPEQVRDVLIAAARDIEEVLDDPAPNVWFKEFGDSSLNFELLAWTSRLLNSPGEFRSKLLFAIHRRLDEAGITIPFPQRDLHVRSGELSVRMTREDGSSGDA